MTKYNIHYAKAHLSEIIQQTLLGEEVIIARDNKPVVRLVPLITPKHKRKLGIAKGLVKISSDFNESLADFKDYEK